MTDTIWKFKVVVRALDEDCSVATRATVTARIDVERALVVSY